MSADKQKAVKHYTDMLKEIEDDMLDDLIASYKVIGMHPCTLNVDTFIGYAEQEHEFKVPDNIKAKFQQYLDAEILRAGDYNE